MRILFYLPAMNSGGAERVVSVISKVLADDHEVHILTLNTSKSFYELDPRVDICSCGITTAKMGKIRRLISLPFMELGRIIKSEMLISQNKPDVIISFLFTTNLISALLKPFNKKKLVISERNDPTKYSKLQQFFCKWSAKRADAVVCQSEFVKQYYLGSNKKCFVIPNPLEENSIYFGPDVKERTKEIIAIGRLVKQKNYPMLIQGFYKSGLADKGYYLTIYGKGQLQHEIQTLIDDLSMQSAIRLAGEKHHIFKEKYNAAMYIMTSDYEGFPNALFEALASMVPVICTDFSTKVASEYITDGDNGFLVSCKNADELANKMNAIASDPTFANNMGKKNKELATTLSVNNISRLWNSIINIVKEQ